MKPARNTALSFLLRALLLAALAVPPARAQPGIRSPGVLGNSGEAGDTLVRLAGAVDGRSPLTGLGIDADGFLWAFGGTGVVNRYSVDGRQLGSYPIPQGNARAKLTLSVVGGQVLLLDNGRLYALPSDAKAGDRFAELPFRARTISTSAIGNRIGMITPEGGLAVFDAVTRQTESRGPLPQGARGDSVVLLPDGALIVDSALRIGPDGETTQVKLHGANPVSIDDKLYAFSWNSTIQRMGENGSPDPGVVLGGSSGSFIGTLPKDGELNQPSGLVKIDDRRYAATSPLGIISILDWSDRRRGFEWVRRIGAVHRSSGLGVDRQGRVWWNCGYWNWDDGPAAYPKNTDQMTDDDGWQVAFLASDAMVGLSSQRGKPVLVAGAIAPAPRSRFDRGVAEAADALPAHSTGAVVLGAAGREEGVFVNAGGEGVRLALQADGRFRALLGKCAIKTASGAPAITSLGRTPEEGLLAADGGAIVRLRAEGGNWTETARLTGWADQKFGAKIFIATDSDRLWVSDTGNNRVLLFRLAGDGPLPAPAIFTGDNVIGALSSPGRIAARGDRAVVVDEGNQRLVKLEMTGW